MVNHTTYISEYSRAKMDFKDIVKKCIIGALIGCAFCAGVFGFLLFEASGTGFTLSAIPLPFFFTIFAIGFMGVPYMASVIPPFGGLVGILFWLGIVLAIGFMVTPIVFLVRLVKMLYYKSKSNREFEDLYANI